MPPLRRHQLAHLSAAGWSEVLSRRWDATARECLHRWAQRRLPLVVTQQQPAMSDGDTVALGLPAPQAWERRRIALQVPRSTIAWLDEFPRATDALRLLPARARPPVRASLESVASLGVQARVYGSHGWQLISGERYLHADSDLDLWMTVEDPLQADAVAHRLQSMSLARPRIDGELVFVDGTAVAWREWATWRAGRARGLLVKRLSGATIEHRLAMPSAVMGCAA